VGEYLAGRGLGTGAIARYDLWGSRRDITGDTWAPLKNRVGIPLYSPDGRVTGYTGRSIDGHKRRYHTEPAVATAQSLWFEQLATGGLVLVIVEGQFDAMAIDWVAYCAGLPVHCVAMGGTARTRGKIVALERLSRNYRRTVVLLDSSAIHRALRMQSDMSTPVMLGQLPTGVGDPGDLHARQTRRLLDGWCSSSLCA
jgi:DNA primase